MGEPLAPCPCGEPQVLRCIGIGGAKKVECTECSFSAFESDWNLRAAPAPKPLPDGEAPDWIVQAAYAITDDAEDTAHAIATIWFAYRDTLQPKPLPDAPDTISEHAVADAFWEKWREVGEPHVHGYYESTWMSIRAALKAAGFTFNYRARTLTPPPDPSE